MPPPGDAQDRAGRHWARIRFIGNGEPPSRSVVGQYLFRSRWLEVSEVYSFIALPNKREFELCFHREGSLRKFSTRFADRSAEGEWKDFELHSSVPVDTLIIVVKFWTARTYDYDIEQYLRRYCTLLKPVEKMLDEYGLFYGVRRYRVKLHRTTPDGRPADLPNSITLGPYNGKITYSGQIQRCYICQSTSHQVRDCDVQKCWKCGQTGHKGKECTNVGVCSLCREEGHTYFTCPHSYSNRAKQQQQRQPEPENHQEAADDNQDDNQQREDTLPPGSQQSTAPPAPDSQRSGEEASSVSQRRPTEEQQRQRKPSASTSAKQRQPTSGQEPAVKPQVKPRSRAKRSGTVPAAGVSTTRDGTTLTDAAAAVATAFSPSIFAPLLAAGQREAAPASAAQTAQPFLFGNTQSRGSQESSTQASLPSFQVPRNSKIEDSLGLRPLDEVLSELSDESQNSNVGLEEAIDMLCGASQAYGQGDMPAVLQLSPDGFPPLPGKRERVSPDQHNHGKKKSHVKKPFKV